MLFYNIEIIVDKYYYILFFIFCVTSFYKSEIPVFTGMTAGRAGVALKSTSQDGLRNFSCYVGEQRLRSAPDRSTVCTEMAADFRIYVQITADFNKNVLNVQVLPKLFFST